MNQHTTFCLSLSLEALAVHVLIAPWATSGCGAEWPPQHAAPQQARRAQPSCRKATVHYIVQHCAGSRERWCWAVPLCMPQKAQQLAYGVPLQVKSLPNPLLASTRRRAGQLSMESTAARHSPGRRCYPDTSLLMRRSSSGAATASYQPCADSLSHSSGKPLCPLPRCGTQPPTAGRRRR